MRLLSITKLQNLKAIHNCFFFSKKEIFVVINHKTTKFESNSQLGDEMEEWLSGCYQSQNYKIWKQFTTDDKWYFASIALLSITKLQNLKAIHNFCTNVPYGVWLLSITKLQNLKAIHNTCLLTCLCWVVVINRKTTKFESNSQHKCLIYQIVQQ